MIKKPLEPQYITDTAGNKLVIITQDEFDSIIKELEGQDDIRLYDEAKKDENDQGILFSDYLKNRKESNC